MIHEGSAATRFIPNSPSCARPPGRYSQAHQAKGAPAVRWMAAGDSHPSATRDFWCVSVIRRMHASNRAMAWLGNLIKAVGRQVPDDDAGLGRCLRFTLS